MGRERPEQAASSLAGIRFQLDGSAPGAVGLSLVI
jgi:hypothetical protein